jgi:mannose-6-phosphate isomerase-like protein (cupin superfamily)
MAKARRKARTVTKSRARAKTSARRRAAARPKAKAKTKNKAKVKARPKHKFTVSHHREEDFLTGLRDYAKYRDLGMKEATGGMVQAHVIRLMPPVNPEEVSKLHYHDVDFQMVYVLRGWMKNEFEGQGVQLMREGTAWIQPPGIRHKVLDYSDDCEVLEIILPAEFDTVTLD